MKKLLVLSVLLGLMALPMFASDITFGGDVTFGFMSDFSGDVGPEKRDLTFDIKAKIDDFSSLTINVDNLESITTIGGISKALVTTDIGKWLGLPVGVKLSWGYDDPDANEFQSVSEYGNEEVFNFSPDEYWGFALLVSSGFVEFELAMEPGFKNAAFPENQGMLLVGLAVKEPIPGLNAEAYWFQGGNDAAAPGVLIDEFDKGKLGIDAAYSTEVAGIGLDAGVGFLYDMDDTATNAWAWGVGLAAAVSMADITLDVYGNETDAFAGLDASVIAKLVDKLSVYGGLQMSFVSGDDAFQGADIGINPHMGAVEAYIGYLITSNGAGELKSDFGPPTDGGFYIKFDVNY